MKTIQTNYNPNYSELKQFLQNLNLLKIASIVTVMIGCSLLMYFYSEVAIAGIALCALSVVTLKSLKMDFYDINIDFDIADIIDDMEADWR